MSAILIVDADAASRDDLRSMLAAASHDLYTAGSGKEALREATARPPDLVLVSARLPEIDGFETCRLMRLDPLLTGLPIVMILDLDDRTSRNRALESGADDVIAQPLDARELLALVRTIARLDQYRQRRSQRDALQRERVRSGLAFEAALTVWARALELRGAEHSGHMARVLPLAARLARALGMPESELPALRVGVLLHDIGLMGVPDNVLDRAGPADEAADARLREHPAYARDLLAACGPLQAAMEIPFCHHERWDGTGYPRGLKGGDIPLPARLFAVVDAWDEARAQPPRGRGLNRTQAAAWVESQAGSRFDPAIATAFLRIVQNEEAPDDSSAGLPTPAASSPAAGVVGSRARGWSLVTQGVRVHFTIGILLIAILPLLSLFYFVHSGAVPDEARVRFLVTGAGVVAAMMALGYGLLSKYPSNIVSLRRQLESLARGVLPVGVDLAKDEDDLVAIEKSVRDIVQQAAERVRTIERQTEDLLIAERQRVAIEGLGAACHHLGQPATSIRMALHLVRRARTPEEREALLVQCEEAADAIADTLQKLQHIARYRTEPYLAASPASPDHARPAILDIGLDTHAAMPAAVPTSGAPIR